MHDLLDNPEIAAASKVRGGRSGQDGRIGLQPIPSQPVSQPLLISSTPRADHSRGVSVFAPAKAVQSIPAPAPWVGASSRQAPPAITRAAPAYPAGLRIV